MTARGLALAVGALFPLVGCASVGADAVDFTAGVRHALVADGSPFGVERFSVCAWVRLQHMVQPQVFINRGARRELFTLYLYKDRVRFLVGAAGGGYEFVTAVAPELDRWVHYAGTFDGAWLRIYRDGGLAAERRLAEWRAPSPVDAPLFLGAEAPDRSPTLGQLCDVRVYARALEGAEVAAVRRSGVVSADDGVSAWQQVEGGQWRDAGRWRRHAALATRAASRPGGGYRGIWYANQPSGDEYRFKYAGGFATYPQQHVPIAIHAAAVHKTFFAFGAADDDNRLQHAVGVFDHRTGEVLRPTILLDKHTSDAHDNPVLALDADGHVWVFSPAHGRSRAAFVHRSTRPYDVAGFERVRAGNFSYPQPWFVSGHGLCFLHTRYDGRRSLYCQRRADGGDWEAPRLLAGFGQGHYQVSWRQGGRVATVFNYHPESGGLNRRTNLYYMETRDGGRSFCNARGEPLDLPLRAVDNPARILELESHGLLVYLKDLQFDANGHPVILYLTSRGYQAGPANDPRTLRVRRYDGTAWQDAPVTTTDHNYDHGSLYLEAQNRWVILAPTGPGPQRYNTGGEIERFVSTDGARTWRRSQALTAGSRFNHTYLRRPVDAHPGFYGLWADGHGRQRSASSLYFVTRDQQVFRLPRRMIADRERPELVAGPR